MEKSLYNVSAFAGIPMLCYVGYHISSSLLFHLHVSQLQRYHHPDSWALVTGASDGIGLAFVHELAARGFNVILHGRNPTKLNNLVRLLEQQYRSQAVFKVLVLDAATPSGPAFDEAVLSCVRDLELRVVVHNVGGSGDSAVEMQLFEEQSSTQLDLLVDINARFMTQLTRLLLPKLCENQPGLMLFVSSAITEIAAPYVAMHTATKCYLEGLVKCLRLEMKVKGHDVEMMSLTMGTVATTSSGRTENDVSFTMPSARAMARASLNKVGWGSAKSTPWIGHWVQFGLIKMLPVWIQDRLVLKMVQRVEEGFSKRE